MFYAILIASMALTGLANALRGAGLGGSSSNYLRPVVGLCAGAASFAVSGHLIPSALLAAFIWLFLTQPWGRWFMIGEGARELSFAGSESARRIEQYWEIPIERITDRIFEYRSGWSDAAAWLISASVFALPMTILLSPWWALMPPLMILIYIIGVAALTIKHHVRPCEAATGALIGAMAVLIAGCAPPPKHWTDITNGVGQIIKDR